MEMNKSGKNITPLQQAMQEFEEFKNGNTLPAIATGHAAPPRVPQYADKMLRCATHLGLASQMILKLSPDHAEIVEVCKLTHKLTSGMQHGVTDKSNHVLRTHALVLGNFEGCPHCASTGIAYCSKCHTLSCLGPDTGNHCCPCCGYTAPLKFSGINVGLPEKNQKRENGVVKAIIKTAQMHLPTPKKTR